MILKEIEGNAEGKGERLSLSGLLKGVDDVKVIEGDAGKKGERLSLM